MKVNAIGKVNQSFDGVGDRLEQNLTARGFGKSGKLVSGQKGVEIARAGAMGNLESQFAAMALDEENRVIDDAMRFSFSNPGQNTVLPGSAAGSAISSGVESLTSLFALNQLLSGKPIW